jgi:alpha-D-xyloside xylohydrolase
MLPYIYSIAGAAYHNNYTIMRGLVMDFPKDTIANVINDQYLFGPSILVNPVYNFGARNREVYLPKGTGWYDLYSDKYFNGGRKIAADAPYERMPLFIKEGSIIPFGPDLQYTSEKTADTIQLYVYTGRDASFQLYEDEGTNYNYERGFYSNIRFDYDERNKTLTIQNRTGDFPGMLKQRVFKIIWISKDNPVPLNFDMAGTLVQYDGNKQIVKMK